MAVVWPTEGLATCRWCLCVIHRSRHLGWLHLHEGLYMCRRPLPGAPPCPMAMPLPVGGALEHLLAIGFRPPGGPALPGDSGVDRGGGGPDA